MDIKTEHVLSKTAKGIDAARSGAGLSDQAKAILKLIDGRKNAGVLKTVVTAAGMATADFQAAVAQLQQGGYVQSIERSAEAPSGNINAEVEKQMMVTLDFTSEFVEQKQKSLGISGAMEIKKTTAAAETAKQQAEERARQAKAARMKLEADIRQKLAAAIRPQIEEELRIKLGAKIEEELRPKMIAALRPGIEAEVRAQLQKELTPRVELELKTRLARSMASQMSATIPPAPKANVVADAVPVAPAADPADKKFERMLASMGDPVFCIDKSLKCTYLSAAWAQFSGRGGADAVDHAFTELFEADDRRGVEKMLNGVCGGTALRFDYQARLTRKDAEPLWVELKTAPLYSQDGQLDGVCGILRDITEERRHVEAAEVAGVRLLLLIDQIDTGVLLEDHEGNIQQVNPAFCALLSVDAAPFSLEGMPTRELLQRVAGVFVDREGFERRMAEIASAGDDVKGEMIMLADGRVLEQDYMVVNADGDAGGHIWLFREVRRGR